MVHGEGQRVPGTGRRVGRARRAVDPPDPLAGHEHVERVLAGGDHHRRVEHLELAAQERGAGGDLVGLRVAVARRPALDHVGDEHVLALPADRLDELGQESPGGADERPAGLVLIATGTLADDHDLGFRVALAGDRPGPLLVEPAAGANGDLRGDGLERGAAPSVGHTALPTAARVEARTDPAARDEELGDLDRVGRRALAQVVADDPQGQAAAVGDRRVAADPPDIDLVVAGGVDRQRVDVAGRVVADDHAGDGREQLPGALGRDRVAGLDVDRLGVAGEDRDPDGRARDPQLGQVQDLAALGDDLPLLAGVAVVEEDVDLGQRVERDLVGVDRGHQRLARGVGPELVLELDDRVRAGPRHALVGVDHDALETDGVAQGHQHRRELHRRAVGVGDDALVERRVVGVDLADHEGHARRHPPRVRVVDDRGPVGDRGRRQDLRDRGAGREQGEVDAVERLGHGLDDLVADPVDGDRRSG